MKKPFQIFNFNFLNNNPNNFATSKFLFFIYASNNLLKYKCND